MEHDGYGAAYRTGRPEPKAPEPLAEAVLHQLRRIGLLEGEALTPVWDAIQRDPEVGRLLLNRHGVRLGRDGDRLYVRADPPRNDGPRHRPDYAGETNTLATGLRPKEATDGR